MWKLAEREAGISAPTHSYYMIVALATWCLKQTTECSGLHPDMAELFAFWSLFKEYYKFLDPCILFTQHRQNSPRTLNKKETK